MDWTRVLRQAVRNSLRSPVWTCEVRERDDSCLWAVRADRAVMRWPAAGEPLEGAVVYVGERCFVWGDMWAHAVVGALWLDEEPRWAAVRGTWVECESRKFLRGHADRHPVGMWAKTLPDSDARVYRALDDRGPIVVLDAGLSLVKVRVDGDVPLVVGGSFLRDDYVVSYDDSPLEVPDPVPCKSIDDVRAETRRIARRRGGG